MDDQDLLNDISFGKVGMYPAKYGITAPFINDKKINISHYYKSKENNNECIPKNIIKYLVNAFTPFVIHQWNGKWMMGSGLTIFRRIAQYYIRYAGIWEETCKKFPGYCTK